VSEAETIVCDVRGENATFHAGDTLETDRRAKAP